MTAPDLPEFLLERLDEDEAVARTASDGRWYVERREAGVLTDETRADVLTAGTTAPSFAVAYDEAFGGCSTVDATHIARHDPARVLADCAAKRAIVEQYRRAVALQVLGEAQVVLALAVVLQRLVQPFASHPDFDSSWRS